MHDCLRIAAGVVATMTPNADNLRAQLVPEMLATDLADYLVRKVCCGDCSAGVDAKIVFCLYFVLALGAFGWLAGFGAKSLEPDLAPRLRRDKIVGLSYR